MKTTREKPPTPSVVDHTSPTRGVGTARTRANGSVEHRFTHARLSKPHYSTHKTVEDALYYGHRLKRLLDAGKPIPVALLPLEEQAAPTTRRTRLYLVLRSYLDDSNAAIAPSDRPMVEMLQEKLDVDVEDITVAWVDGWVRDMKRKEKLAPGTIRKRVESLARAIDWHLRRSDTGKLSLHGNPLRSLPNGYSAYTDADAEAAGARKVNVERDRRLEPGEDEKIQAAIKGCGRPEADELLALYLLIVNTALRLREAYTLTRAQVRLDDRTIVVSKSKTGAKRQVPMTPKVHALLTERLLHETDAGVFPSIWNGTHEALTLKRTTERLSSLFARLFEAAGCVDLREHDLRHEATCRWMLMKDKQGRWLFRPEEVRKITGHKSEAMFMRYLSLRGSDLADRLWEG